MNRSRMLQGLLASEKVFNINDLNPYVYLDTRSFSLSNNDKIITWVDESGNVFDFAEQGDVLYKTDIFNDRSAVFNDVQGDYIKNASGVPFLEGDDITFSYVFKPLVWSGNNPGVWRSGEFSSGADGGNFFIYQGTTGRPWVRLGGLDVLKPSVGHQVNLNNAYVITLEIASGDSINYYVNGELEYNVSISATVPALSIYNIMQQNNKLEYISGNWGQFLFFRRILTTQERIELTNNQINTWL